jgi:hypothetical protein
MAIDIEAGWISIVMSGEIDMMLDDGVMRAPMSKNHAGFLPLLTGLSAIYDPASWALAQFDAPHAKLYRRGHVPAAWLGMPFRQITPEEDNGTGRVEMAEHRCR